MDRASYNMAVIIQQDATEYFSKEQRSSPKMILGSKHVGAIVF